MGLFDRLLGRKAPEGNERGTEVATGPCLHTALGPRWDSADDMGDESKANSYRCEACGESFTPEQANANWAKKFESLEGKPYYKPVAGLDGGN